MDTDELNEALAAKESLTRDQLLALLKCCEAHLALRKKTIDKVLAEALKLSGELSELKKQTTLTP